ncbi:PAS domain-containing protein [Paenibacillus timonensis]|nr:PAS domain-containing protein [Paenibacillus timonensis]
MHVANILIVDDVASLMPNKGSSELAEWSQVTENSRVTIKLLDLKGTILFASPSHRRTYGQESNTYIRNSVFDFMYSEDIAKFIYATEIMMAKKESVSLQLRMRYRTHRWIRVETVCSPIYDPEGKIGNIVMTSRKIGVK